MTDSQRRKIKYLHSENMKWIARINEKARALGMSYGEYVSKFGAEVSRTNKRRKK